MSVSCDERKAGSDIKFRLEEDGDLQTFHASYIYSTSFNQRLEIDTKCCRLFCHNFISNIAVLKVLKSIQQF